ncbi:BhlA/UviB family holin-like peptide [Bacillus sp. 03113]|uniref:BhlA/UviB family holin-like peptide n=1 Tax=Bacillus sp. 03113 TaxID=2578211 RepID=UPI0011448768|nr:BhlA/UviB family holin-like peptide [Bacillus sp. 03113]
MTLWDMFQKVASQYGLPFALFIALLVWVLYTNNQRENRYIAREDKYVSVIQTLSEDVKERLTKIETRIFDGGDK